MEAKTKEWKEMMARATAAIQLAKTKQHSLDLARNAAGLEPKEPGDNGAKKGDTKKKTRGV
jgi:hypothetical protein